MYKFENDEVERIFFLVHVHELFCVTYWNIILSIFDKEQRYAQVVFLFSTCIPQTNTLSDQVEYDEFKILYRFSNTEH